MTALGSLCAKHEALQLHTMDGGSVHIVDANAVDADAWLDVADELCDTCLPLCLWRKQFLEYLLWKRKSSDYSTRQKTTPLYGSF